MKGIVNKVDTQELLFLDEVTTNDLTKYLGGDYKVIFITIGDVECNVWYEDDGGERVGLYWDDENYFGNVIIEVEDSNAIEKVLNELSYEECVDEYRNEEYFTFIQYNFVVFIELDLYNNSDE